MKFKILIITLIISTFCISASAHQDRIIELKGNKLIGLPEQYQPATLSIPNRQLTIGNNTVIMPDSIWNCFGDTQKSPLRFSASWYHELYVGDLHPYMSIRNANFELLLNLDTLEIIEVSWNPEIPPEHLKQWEPKQVPPPR